MWYRRKAKKATTQSSKRLSNGHSPDLKSPSATEFWLSHGWHMAVSTSHRKGNVSIGYRSFCKTPGVLIRL